MDEQNIAPPKINTPENISSGINLSQTSGQNTVPDEKNTSRNKTLMIVISIAVFLFITSSTIYAYIFFSAKKAALSSQPEGNQTANESAKQAGDIESTMEYQLKNKIFQAGLSKDKVTEVHLGGYSVPAGTLEAIQAAIQERIGVPVTIDSNYPETIPEDDSIYNKSRQQFDGDAMWQNSSANFEGKNTAARYLVVINEDIFTNVQPERPYIMSRALPNLNNVIISVKRLQKYSDSSSEPSSEERYQERVGKLAVRVLGVTVGLSLTPDADNINCLMYQAKNIDELDKVGTDFCKTTKEALGKIFMIQD